MASISKQNTRISIFEEVTPNTTPDDAAFQVLRFSNDAFGASANQVVDPTIVTDRFATSSTRVGMENRGTIGMVLRHDDAIETLFEGAFGDTWTVDSLDTLSEKHTYTLVKHYGATPLYPHRFTGVMVNGFTLTVPSEGLINVAFDLQGGPTPLNSEPPTSVGGPTYPASTPSGKLGMVSSDASITWVGAGFTPLNAVCVTDIELRYNNNIEGVKCIGVEGEEESNLGQSQVEGTATVFLETSAMYDAFLAESTGGISVTCTDGTQTYTFTASDGRLKLKEYAVPVEGNSGSVVAQIGFDITGIGSSNLTLNRAV